MNKRGKLALIALSVIVVLFLGGLSLQFFKSGDSVSGLAVNERNLANANAFSYGHACTRNSDCRSNICNGKKCVDCLTDNKCREGYYCNASKNCVPKAEMFFPCRANNGCLSNYCYDGVCWDTCSQDDPCFGFPDGQECRNGKCIPLVAYDGAFSGGIGNGECGRNGRQVLINGYPFFADVCLNYNNLLEGFCSEEFGFGNTYVFTDVIKCKVGQICSKGACVVNLALQKPDSVKTPTLSKIRVGVTNLFRR